MIRVDIRRTIDRPIEEVFDRLVDIARYPEWMPESGIFRSCTQDSPGPVDVGTRYTDYTPVGAIPGEVVELERPHRVVFHYVVRLLGATAMEGWPGYTLEPHEPARTIVHHRAEARLYGPFRMLRPLVQRLADGERGRTVDALKRSFE